jgi:dTDP-4-dehydrorhamnose 3,5-epimerase
MRPLDPHGDERGQFVELYRREWNHGIEPVQWNAVWSEAGVLRGVHVHIRHDDYLTVPVGRASVGLRDLRRGSPTEGLATIVELGRDQPAALVIPHGVAHGFYFHEPSLHVYAVTEYWDPGDELGCNWADPELGIPWPVVTARVSDRDRAAQPLQALLAELERNPAS